MKSLNPIRNIDIYLLDQFMKGRLTSGMTVFDAGCGHGRNIRWLLQSGYQVSAIDVNEEVIAGLKAGLPAFEESFSTSRIEDYHTETLYDFVICNAVLHFARDHGHFEAMFGSLVQLMKPGATLFIRMTSDIGLEGQIGDGKEGVFILPDGSTRYLITRIQVDELLSQHGLRLVEPVKTVFVDGLRSMTTLVLQE